MNTQTITIEKRDAQELISLVDNINENEAVENIILLIDNPLEKVMQEESLRVVVRMFSNIRLLKREMQNVLQKNIGV